MSRKKRPPDSRRKVVKVCLLNHLHVPQLLPEINRWVFHLSKIYHRGASFFHLHLLRLLENFIDLPSFDQSFFNQCFTTGMNHPYKPDTQLLESWNQFQNLFPPIDRINGDTQAINYLAKKYQVNFFNDLKMNFFRRQFKLLALICPTKTIASQVQAMLNQRKPWDPDIINQLDPINQTWITLNRNLFTRMAPNQLINDAWVADHPDLALIYTYVIQKVFYQLDVTNFSIVPVVTVKSHFITIDTKVLYHMTKNVGLHSEKNVNSFNENRTTYWQQFFKINQLGKETHFAEYLETDGIAVAMHFETMAMSVQIPPISQTIPSTILPDPNSSTSSPNLTALTTKSKTIQLSNPNLTNRRVLANDPGRTNLAYIVEECPDGSIKKYVLTKGQYYHESHINRANRNVRRWSEEIEDLNNRLSQTTHQTPQSSELIRYIQAFNQEADRHWSHMTQKRYARNRMDVYIHKNKCLDRFFQSLVKENPEKPVIAYGDAKFAPTGRGEVSGPTTFMAKKCAQHHEVIMVNEFRTSKMCHDCGEELTLLYHDANSEIKMTKEAGHSYTKIRGLRWCGSTKCRKLRNRDENAALNILKIAKASERPENLTRKLPLRWKLA
jgi:hypothetical protein